MLAPAIRGKNRRGDHESGATAALWASPAFGCSLKSTSPPRSSMCLITFDHVKKLIGAEHLRRRQRHRSLGLRQDAGRGQQTASRGYKGSYGFREMIDIEGINHPKRMFDLAEGLIRRKYSNAEIEGILGGNFARVLKQITAGGIVFGGSNEGNFFALDALTGKPLWDFRPAIAANQSY